MTVKIVALPIEGLNYASIKGGAKFGQRMLLGTSEIHLGIDAAAKLGTPIHAVADGKVIVSKMQGNGKGYGNYIVIRHAGGDSLYGHQSKRIAVAGATVKAGDIIGLVGSTGRSTGPHLHFGICTNFNVEKPGWVDPLPQLLSWKEEEEDMEPVQVVVEINGVESKVNTILFKNENYVKIKDLADADKTDKLTVAYNAQRKRMVIVTK